MSQIVTITISIALPDDASLSVDTIGEKTKVVPATVPAAVPASAPAPAPVAQQANDPEPGEPVKRGRGRPRKTDTEPTPAPAPVAQTPEPAASGYRTMPEPAPAPVAPPAATTGGVMDSVKALLGDWQ